MKISHKPQLILVFLAALLGSQLAHASHLHISDYFDSEGLHALSDCIVCYADAADEASCEAKYLTDAVEMAQRSVLAVSLQVDKQAMYSKCSPRAPPQ